MAVGRSESQAGTDQVFDLGGVVWSCVLGSLRALGTTWFFDVLLSTEREGMHWAGFKAAANIANMTEALNFGFRAVNSVKLTT